MNEIEEEDKKLMLETMYEKNWGTDTNEDSTYEEVEKDFNEMNIEFDAIENDQNLDLDF